MSKITYIVGDLFLSPGNTILVHACNTQGSWGAGIASAFRSKYPVQFQSYKRHCNERDSAQLIGTCLLLPGNSEEEHDIACLFTSRAYGKRKDKPDVILENTRSAVLDLMRQNEKGKALNAWYLLHLNTHV